LSALTNEEERIRTIAGYLLKNNARLILTAPQDVSEFVKTAVLSAFNDNAAMIRSAASQDIVAFLGILEPRNWPECLHHLFMALDSEDLEKQEVCFFPLLSTTSQEFLSRCL
jgi:transportin-1